MRRARRAPPRGRPRPRGREAPRPPPGPARAPPGAAAGRGHGSTGPRGQPHGQGRVVGPHRPRPHQHGVGPGPQPVGVEAGGLAGDPPAGPVRCGGPPVERGGQLEHHPGPSRAPVLQVRGQLLGDRLGPHPHLDLDARGPQPVDPAPGHLRVGVLDGHHHPPDARRPRRPRCRVACGRDGRRAPASRTGSPPRPGHPPRPVRPPRHGARRAGRWHRRTTADGTAGRHHDRSHPRVRRGAPPDRLGRLDGAPHPVGVAPFVRIQVGVAPAVRIPVGRQDGAPVTAPTAARRMSDAASSG